MYLIYISVLPVIILATYIYKKDKSREPKKLLFKLFLGGIGSIFLTLLITYFFGMFFPIILAETNELDYYSLFIHVFFGVALIEEFSKWFVLYKMSYNHSELDQVFDLVVYSAFVALGFACFENILYVLEHGMLVGVIRGIFAVPGHFFDGVFMGYYLSMAKLADINNSSSTSRYMVLSLLVPVLLHGFYDFCLFSNSIIFICLFLLFMLILYIKSFKKIKKLSNENRKFRYNNKFCPYCGTPVNSDCCPGCGGKNE